ncbi:hypothetical protein DFH06DRAFT_1359326 [Mycena polygramma]|nr:hypothetical protein DFH06DRAFT_1359326 [Mycena polygramma]
MAPICVTIKHSGKNYAINLDPDLPAKAFKDEVCQATGIPIDRMKVMIKGGFLKDDTPWQKINPKAGKTFTVIGAAGELPKSPEKPVVFLEDMDDTELANALAKPVGLRNLGNTCYMKATLQAMRAISELQTAIGHVLAALPSTLGSLYTKMAHTADTVAPVAFLNLLREINPQFAERDRAYSRRMRALMGGGGYAQQDADECLTTIVSSLGTVPGQTATGAVEANKRFVEQYMTGEMIRVVKCDDAAAADEPPSISTENVLKITCNIDSTVKFMASGIQKSFSQPVIKRSLTLGRDANYTQESRMTRLPAYLFVHMARFSWRADINKKAKIMVRLTSSLSERLCTHPCTCREKSGFPPNTTPWIYRHDRFGGRRAGAQPCASESPGHAHNLWLRVGVGAGQVEGADMGKAKEEGGALEAESAYRERELKALVDPGLKNDVKCSVSGLYQLVAIVTHKGAAADAGHYIWFVKKSVFHPPKLSEEPESEEDWYKFDDDKVSIFPKDRLNTLDGGGEDSSAYVLLYKTKSLA